MTSPVKKLLQTFLTGLLAALPLAATVLVLVWAVRTLYTWVGPGSLIGQTLVSIGLGVTGSEVAGYVIGLGLVLLGIFALGLVVQSRLKAGFHRVVDGVVQRIPVVRHIYDFIQKFVGLLEKPEGNSARAMSPVWLNFGGQPGAAVLALLSSPEAVLLHGQPYLAVIIPTAPVPVGGALLYVPEAWVRPAEVGIDGLTSIYMSMGVSSAQHMPKAGSA